AFLHRPSPQPEWLYRAARTGCPRKACPYVLRRSFFHSMIDSSVMVETGLKLTLPRDLLAERLALVARAVSTRTAVLVLGGIQLRAEAGEFHLAATDMELSLRTSLEADVNGEGEVVVPGRLLLDITRSLPDAEVSIEHLAAESV